MQVVGRGRPRPETVPSRAEWLSGVGGILLSFFLLVVIPTAAAGYYYLFVASDIYVSEAKFAVRGSVEKLPSTSSAALSMFSQVATMNSNQDAYVVSSYIQSISLVEKLSRDVDVREAFTREGIDPIAKLDDDAPAEKLRKYWNRMVIPSVDSLSGVVSLEVRAFRPEDSLTIARAIIKASEELVNEISMRKRSDTVQFARGEVARAEERLRAARLALQAFRDASGVLDPAKSAEALSKLALILRAQKIELESEVRTARRTLSEASPSVQVLSSRLGALNEQIGLLEKELTSQSGDEKAASRVLSRFEGLELEREFAEKIYVIAQAAFERARVEADRQQLYLVTFVQPALAERAIYPRRIADTAVVGVSVLAVWSILVLLVAAVRDHDV